MITDIDMRYFSKASQIASMSDFARTHVGCVAVYRGRIIGIGCNTNKTHPDQKYYNRFRNTNENDGIVIHKAHAEIRCLNSVKDMDVRWSKVKLYIYRQRRDIPHGIARPCKACMAAIIDLGIQDVYYTTDEGFAYEKIKYMTHKGEQGYVN